LPGKYDSNTENPRVGGSIPSLATIKDKGLANFPPSLFHYGRPAREKRTAYAVSANSYKDTGTVRLEGGRLQLSNGGLAIGSGEMGAGITQAKGR
jgi:hypothetical protein